MMNKTVDYFFEEYENFEPNDFTDGDCYINFDSPDISHFTYTEDSGEIVRAVRLTVFDTEGEPSHSAFNIDSLNVLIKALTYAQENICETEDDGETDE